MRDVPSAGGLRGGKRYLQAKLLGDMYGVPAPQILRMMDEGGTFILAGKKVAFIGADMTPLPGCPLPNFDSYAPFRDGI